VSLIDLLLFILICVLIIGVIEYALRALPLPPPWAVVIRIVMAVILLLVLIGLLTGGINPIRIR
jgi:hypothetical protein